jgi:hypothetical protein
MVIKRTLKIGGFAIALIAISILVLSWLDEKENPGRVAFMLNIPSLPKSVQVLECQSPLIPTDLVLVCALEVSQEDFPELLKGFDFSQSSVVGSSHLMLYDKVGPEFPVTHQFIARPKEFKNGGQVTVLADMEMQRVVIDYYEE